MRTLLVTSTRPLENKSTVVHFDHKGGTMVNRKRRFKPVIEFHRGSYICFQKHHMTSFWHPVHLLTVIGLGLRFLASLP
jgi:hypothetical protein